LAKAICEIAPPYLIIVFRRIYESISDGQKKTIITFKKALVLLLASFELVAIHDAGLVFDIYPAQ
jgi:hypothetical protein